MKYPTVLVAGLPNDPCVKSVLTALEKRGIHHRLWNQRQLLNDCVYQLKDGRPEGWLLIDDTLVELSAITGSFNRISEIELTPEFRQLDANAPIARHALLANWRLGQWFELSPQPVLNRATANESNSAKAFQAQLIRHYLSVPDTLITNNVTSVREFWQEHGRIVYKSCSGERSIVTELTEEILESRAATLATCPVLFQQYIDGTDVRVHVVDSEVFATAVESSSTDYRYDHHSKWTAIELPADYARACIALSRALDLDLSGIDLRITPAGEAYCFEINPSPAFSVYEEATGLPIADAIATYLMD